MPEKVMPGPVEGTGGIREAVCVHTRKIYDSCRDKDCIEDLRFYPFGRYVFVPLCLLCFVLGIAMGGIG